MSSLNIIKYLFFIVILIYTRATPGAQDYWNAGPGKKSIQCEELQLRNGLGVIHYWNNSVLTREQSMKLSTAP